MTSPYDQVWLMTGHDLIFDKIMLLIGHSSLEDLDRCRLVCKTWNDKIIMKIWKNPTKSWGTVIQRRIERSWAWETPLDVVSFPSHEQISKVKLLGKIRIKVISNIVLSILI